MKIYFYPVDSDGVYIDVSTIASVEVYDSTDTLITDTFTTDGARIEVSLADTVKNNIKIIVDGTTTIEDYVLIGKDHEHDIADVSLLQGELDSKADIVTAPTENNIVSLTSAGNIQDSGVPI